MKEFLNRFHTFSQKTLYLDLRSLALMRILISILILCDLAVRAMSLTAHYTDVGVLPADFFWKQNTGPLFSLHFLNGSSEYQIFLFLIQGIFALLLLLGFKTKITTIISWVLLISLQHRNFLLLSGADSVLKMVLFWGMFLPWGARFSIDSLKYKLSNNNTFLSLATLAFLIQIASIYWFNALFKSSPIWRSEGTAIYYALRVDDLVQPFGLFLLELPPIILKIMTLGVWWLEALGPFLLFIPIFSTTFRFITIISFIIFHSGIGFSMRLGIFPWVCIFAWLGILPKVIWDKLLLKLPIIHTLLKARGAKEEKEYLKFYHSAGLQLLAFFFILFITLWNIASIPGSFLKLPNLFRKAGIAVSINQTWRMFAPRPGINSGWFVIPGVLKDGKVVDIYKNGAEVTFEKPNLVVNTYKDLRWNKYLSNISQRPNDKYRIPYLKYLCWDWNRRHNDVEQLVSMALIYMWQITPPDYGPYKLKKETIKTYQCGS